MRASPPRRPIGAVLAGGLGRRIGGSKATSDLRGRPLISYPLEALRAALGDVVIVAKRDTQLPSPPGAPVWIEPKSPRHPLAGIVHALARAEGRAVLVGAADMALLTAETIERLATADPGASAGIVACADGRLEPLLACFQPGARDLLAAAPNAFARPLRDVIAVLRPVIVEVDDDTLFNVNSHADLLQAARMLESWAKDSPLAARSRQTATRAARTEN